MATPLPVRHATLRPFADHERARKLLADGIRARHPEYTDEQVRLAMIRVWLTPELYRQAYAGYPVVDP